MKPNINPIVDCVFKALLGSRQNTNLLVHFLNAVLGPTDHVQVQEVYITNPYNEKEFLSDKLTIVDVMAVDAQATRFHVEVQLAVLGALKQRMLYNWYSLHARQLKEGDDYSHLRPVYSIWVLADELLNETEAYHHRFTLTDDTNALSLGDSGSIHVIEMPKWRQGVPLTELDRWIRFFLEGETLDDEALPEYMETPEMRQAMETLRQFSERERAQHIYQKRLEYLYQQRETARELKRLKSALERERREKERRIRELEQERREKERRTRELEQERREKERLLALLKEKGIVLD